jgi:hypothetical protein
MLNANDRFGIIISILGLGFTFLGFFVSNILSSVRDLVDKMDTRVRFLEENFWNGKSDSERRESDNKRGVPGRRNRQSHS